MVLSSSRRSSRLVAPSVLIALFAVSFLLLLSMNSLQWPIGSFLNNQNNAAVATSTVQPGMLAVTTQSYRVDGSLSSGATPGGNDILPTIGPLPMGGISLQISRTGSLANPLRVETDPGSGQFSEYVNPGSYTVRIMDGRFGNLSVNVQVSEAKVSQLTATVNETDYAVTQYNLVDSYSSGWFGGWQQVYVNIHSNASIASNPNLRDYLAVSNSTYQFAACQSCLPIPTDTPNFVSATLTSSTQNSDSQWLQIQLGHLMRISGVSGLMLSTQQVTYTVKTVVY